MIRLRGQIWQNQLTDIRSTNRSQKVEYMLKLIKGGKVDLENLLVKALFGDSLQEIERISKLLESIQPSDPTHLKLVKCDHPKPTK